MKIDSHTENSCSTGTQANSCDGSLFCQACCSFRGGLRLGGTPSSPTTFGLQYQGTFCRRTTTLSFWASNDPRAIPTHFDVSRVDLSWVGTGPIGYHPSTMPHCSCIAYDDGKKHMHALQSHRREKVLCIGLSIACMHCTITCEPPRLLTSGRYTRTLSTFKSRLFTIIQRGSTHVSGIPIGVAPGVGTPMGCGDGLGSLAWRS